MGTFLGKKLTHNMGAFLGTKFNAEHGGGEEAFYVKI